MSLTGEAKKEYQREYMRRQRGNIMSGLTGSNSNYEADRSFLHCLSNKEGGLTGGSWKNKGFTPVPNILINNPAVPKCVRLTYMAISGRAFGKASVIYTSRETLAKDIGVSVSTVGRHLAVLEALGLVERSRVGRGITNAIRLPLKAKLAMGGNWTQAIEAELGGLSAIVLKREKLTMKDALKLVSRRHRRQREVSLALSQAQRIIKEYRER